MEVFELNYIDSLLGGQATPEHSKEPLLLIQPSPSAHVCVPVAHSSISKQRSPLPLKPDLHAHSNDPTKIKLVSLSLAKIIFIKLN